MIVILAFLLAKMKLSNTEIQNLLTDYYSNKMLIKECRAKYKIGKSTVNKILKLFGTGGRNRDDYNNNKYSCDESYFDVIDSHEKAYWFGFICADGNIYNQKLQIGLHKKDEQHLLKFCARIGYNGPLHSDKVFKKLIIARKRIVQGLKNLGLSENKTFTIDEKMFDQVPDEYKKSAFLGYIDGDGCFYFSRQGVGFSLVGNFSFLKFTVSFFKERGITINDPKKDKRTKQTYYISKWLSQENCCKMIEMLYSNGSQDLSLIHI